MMKQKNWIVGLLILLALGWARADRSGHSPGIKKFRIPLTWLEQPAAQGPGDYGRRLKHGGLRRYYEVHVPPSYRPGTPTPALLVLHGGGGNPSGMRWQANMEKEADDHGYILIYPAGTHHLFRDKFLFWNVGPKRKNPKRQNVDDVAFLEKVLDDAGQFFTLDEKRLYATGISNGSHMSYRLACESERIAAIAPVGGQEELGRYYQAPSRGLPIMHFHGEQDHWAHYHGGMTGASGFVSRQLPPVTDFIETWVKTNGCQLNSARSKTVGQAKRVVYDGGKDGSEVVFWLLRDGGHTWPSGRASKLEKTGKIGRHRIGPSVGKINRDISAGEEMLRFFDRHHLPE